MALNKEKIIVVAVVLVVSVVADQATKLWAESALATPRYPDHQVVLSVPPDFDGKTLGELIDAELKWTNDEERAVIAARWAERDGTRLRASSVVNEGDEIRLQQRSITVVDGYFDFVYARNPGAAWSFLADAPHTFRMTFFLGTSLLAIVLIGVFLYRAAADQRRLFYALALVLAGAIGNLIDRIAYGYVIDFVAWHVGEHYWPTFNVADAVICVGVGLMAIELLFGFRPKEEQDGEDDPKRAAS